MIRRPERWVEIAQLLAELGQTDVLVIADTLGLPRQAISNTCAAMARHGYLEQAGKTPRRSRKDRPTIAYIVTAAGRELNNKAAHQRVAEQHTDRLRIVLPWPPTVNHSTTGNGRGGRVLTDEHRAFRAEVALRVVSAGSPRFSPDVRLSVEITLVPPDKRRVDIDNRVKATLDALQRALVIADDSQVDDLRVIRGDVVIPGEGSAVVTIREVTP